MSTYVIGDVHGCFTELNSLLNLINFNTKKDTLLFVGDLVGRGPQSKEVLDLVIGLGKSAINVLGNHDLKLLSALCGVTNPTTEDNYLSLLECRDKKTYLDWLSSSKLIFYSSHLKLAVVHAGIPPSWPLNVALEKAALIERYKEQYGIKNLLKILIQEPCLNWKDCTSSEEKINFSLFGFTKIKLCYENGILDKYHQGSLKSSPPQLFPWFQLRNQNHRESTRIIFGHWAALGLHKSGPIMCCDTGCVWGGKLSAIKIDVNMKYYHVKSEFNSASSHSKNS